MVCISGTDKIKCAKKLIIFLMGLTAVFIYIYLANWTEKAPKPVYYPPDSIQCFYSKSDSLPDISYASPAKDKSIFFHETSCKSGTNGKIVINARQACAVESAARSNPNFEVYLLYSSPGLIINEKTESDRFIEALLSYENVKIHHLDFELYAKNAPVEKLFQEGKINESKYAITHSCDILRYLTLWKYGGIYLDLDVLVIKSLEELPLNYAGAESDQQVASGVLSFEHDGVGHNLSTQCLEDLQHNFSGTQWVNNGPGVVTRLTKRICGTNSVSKMTKKECVGHFKVYPSKTFYPIHYSKWKKYFSKDPTGEIRNLTKDSYIVHTWNKLSYKTKLGVGDDVPYINFAKEYCPRVYSQCEKFF